MRITVLPLQKYSITKTSNNEEAEKTDAGTGGTGNENAAHGDGGQTRNAETYRLVYHAFNGHCLTARQGTNPQELL